MLVKKVFFELLGMINEMGIFFPKKIFRIGWKM